MPKIKTEANSGHDFCHWQRPVLSDSITSVVLQNTPVLQTPSIWYDKDVSLHAINN